jgi:hypothetical protein
MMPNSSWPGLEKLIQGIQSIPKAFVFLLAPPFINLLTEVGPPGPQFAYSILTAFFAASAIIFVYLFTDKRKKKFCRRAVPVAFLGAIVIGSLYFFMIDSFVFHTPPEGTNERRVMGTEFLSEAHKQPVELAGSALQALAESDYDPTKIWTQRSITRIRFFLVALWVSLFFTIYMGIAYLAISLGPISTTDKPKAEPDDPENQADPK